MQGQATAVDTPFAECSEEECTVLLDDDKIELQRVTIDIPAGSDVTGTESCCRWGNLIWYLVCSQLSPSSDLDAVDTADGMLHGSGLNNRSCFVAQPEANIR